MDLSDKPKKGHVYRDGDLEIEVMRVARDESWADINVFQMTTNTAWTKRQPLPFPERWIRVL